MPSTSLGTMPLNNGTSRIPTGLVSIFFTDIRAMGRCPCSQSATFCQACLDAGADRYMTKRAFPDPPAASVKELGSDANPHYPWLSTTKPPFPYVKPADIMPPTAVEAEFGIKRDIHQLPVVPVRSCSAPVTLAKGVHQPPAKVKIGPFLRTSGSNAPAVIGTMGPPPRPTKK